MLRDDSQDVLCLIEYINDTKPYHTKLTEVVVEYQYNEFINVNIEDDIYTDIILNSYWNLEFISDGFIKRFKIPAVVLPRKVNDRQTQVCEQVGVTDLITGTTDSYAVPYNAGMEVYQNGNLLIEGLDYELLDERHIVKFLLNIPVLGDDLCFNLFSLDRLFICIDGAWSCYDILGIGQNDSSFEPIGDGAFDIDEFDDGNFDENSGNATVIEFGETVYATDPNCGILRYCWINNPVRFLHVGSTGLDSTSGFDDGSGFGGITTFNNSTVSYNSIIHGNIAAVRHTSLNIIGDSTEDSSIMGIVDGINDTFTVSSATINSIISIKVDLFDVNPSDYIIIGNQIQFLNGIIPVFRVDISYDDGYNPLLIKVQDNIITVKLETDGSGTILSTAADVVNAVNLDPIANTIVLAIQNGDGLGIAIESELKYLTPLYPIPSIPDDYHINDEIVGTPGAYNIPPNTSSVIYMNGIQLTNGVDYELQGTNNEILQFLGTIPDNQDPNTFCLDYTSEPLLDASVTPSGIVGKMLEVPSSTGDYYVFEFVDPLPRGTIIKFTVDQRETYGTWAQCRFTEEFKIVEMIRGLGFPLLDEFGSPIPEFSKDYTDELVNVKVIDTLNIHIDVINGDSFDINISDSIDSIPYGFIGESPAFGITDSLDMTMNFQFYDTVNINIVDIPLGGDWELSPWDLDGWGSSNNPSGNPLLSHEAIFIDQGGFDGPEGLDIIGFGSNTGGDTTFEGVNGFGISGFGGVVSTLEVHIPNFDITDYFADSVLVDVTEGISTETGPESISDTSNTSIQDAMVMVIDYVDATPTDIFGTVSLNGGGYFEQTTPVTLLTVTHNLGYTPVVTTTISGIPVVPNVYNHISNNVLEIGFNTPTAFEILVI